jgi:integrase
MMESILLNGSQIANDLRDSADSCADAAKAPKTMAELLAVLALNPPKSFAMLRSTCVKLADYLETPIDQLLIDSVHEGREGFRAFLVAGKYLENSIRSYVNLLRILLELAGSHGWKPDDAAPVKWRAVLALADEKNCADLARYLSRFRNSPEEVLVQDPERWVEGMIQQRRSYDTTRAKVGRFWRLLRDCGCLNPNQTPVYLLREKNFGTPLERFPEALKLEVLAVLKWKQAEYSTDRPKNGQHRPVTAKRLKTLFCHLYGFATNISGRTDIQSLHQLVLKPIVGGYLEFSINERKVKGDSLLRNLRLLHAALRYHPTYSDMDFSWVKPLMNSIPVESAEQRKKRKTTKYLEYDVIENIPAMIRAQGLKTAKGKKSNIARAAMEALLMKWFITLAWRQRNVREMRIGGENPNLFKARIPPFSDIDKHEWVIDEEQRNPNAEFWQVRFSPAETKMKNGVHTILPRQLVEPLEEYLHDCRPQLLCGDDPDTLFVSHAATAIDRNQMTHLVSGLVVRYAGRRVTPHLFRDIVAFTWLKEHPKDYLTLSKILWHMKLSTTIEIYGSRFNESSGVRSMETWLDERESARSK